MVKTPLYPDYHVVKSLIRILDGVKVSDFKNMWNTVWGLRGTPQNTVDWKNPDIWIPERLSGKDRELALKVWNESNKLVNPRWTRGSQFLMNGYNLIQENNGIYQLNERGTEFSSLNKLSPIINEIDIAEGVIQILLQLSLIENGKRSDLLGDWSDYLKSNSNVKKESVEKDYLTRRLSNLVNRQLIKKTGNSYSISVAGLEYLDYLKQTKSHDNLSEIEEINRTIDRYVNKQRKSLKLYLEKTKPFQFEHIIKDLLDAMGYEDVEVTSLTNDKGVDVTGISQNGITTVKEVIQVKRLTKSNISRTVLDKLRGSLHRFDAFQGTIITLTDFSKGAKDSAFEKGAAPITLINGEKLIDLLVQHKIGINTKTIDYYSVDENYFSNENEENLE